MEILDIDGGNCSLKLLKNKQNKIIIKFEAEGQGYLNPDETQKLFRFMKEHYEPDTMTISLKEYPRLKVLDSIAPQSCVELGIDQKTYSHRMDIIINRHRKDNS